MKVLAFEKERPGVRAEDFQPHLEAEAAAVWALQQREILRAIYFRSDRREAVLVLECADLDEAHRVLASLPLVQAGLIAFEVVGLKPYDGYARLFAQEAHAAQADPEG